MNKIITREQIEDYIESLDYNVSRIWKDAYNESMNIEDTLSDEFQICVSILNLFEKFAEERIIK